MSVRCGARDTKVVVPTARQAAVIKTRIWLMTQHGRHRGSAGMRQPSVVHQIEYIEGIAMLVAPSSGLARYRCTQSSVADQPGEYMTR